MVLILVLNEGSQNNQQPTAGNQEGLKPILHQPTATNSRPDFQHWVRIGWQGRFCLAIQLGPELGSGASSLGAWISSALVIIHKVHVLWPPSHPEAAGECISKSFYIHTKYESNNRKCAICLCISIDKRPLDPTTLNPNPSVRRSQKEQRTRKLFLTR